ncbi:virulence factor Mce, partial [Mycobacterium sp. ITM-2017-0098]
PTVEICESDKPFEPLAMRQHVLGPYPIDPALIAQGVPPDDRITLDDHIFGPIQGTPMPPPAPAAIPSVPSSSTAPAGLGSPSVAFATYNPETGQYASPDGQVHSQSNLVGPAPQSWEDLLPR